MSEYTDNRKPTHASARDIFQSLCFGLLAAVVHQQAVVMNARALEYTGILVLYLSVLFLPRVCGLMATIAFIGIEVLLFNAITPLLADLPPETIRITLFALVLAAFHSERIHIPPFLIICLLWTGYLLTYFVPVAEIRELNRIYLPPLNGKLVELVSIELSGVLLIGIASFSHRANRLFGRTVQYASARVFFTHVLAFPVFMLIAGSLLLFYRADSQLLISAERAALANADTLLLLFVATYLAVCFLGHVIGRSFQSLFASLALKVDPQSKVFTVPTQVLPIEEYRVAARGIRIKTSEAVRVKRQVKEIFLELEAKERELKAHVGGSEDINSLFSRSPWGCIAVNLEGRIVASNYRFFEILSFSPDDMDVLDFGSLLRGPSVWAKEIVDQITWASSNIDRLIKEGPRTYESKSNEGEYLEVYITLEVSAAYRGATGRRDPLPGEVTLLFYVRRQADLRPFQLRFLDSSRLDLLGGRVEGLSESLSERFKRARELLTAATAKAQHLGESEGGELSSLLSEAQHNVHEADGLLTEATSLSQIEDDDRHSVNLSRILEQGVEYISMLAGFEHKPTVCTETDKDKAGSSVALERLPISDTDYIRIYASPYDLNSFLSCFLCILKNIAPDSERMEINIDYELIGTGTADIITGSLPGRYARIVVKHPGQSIPGYMMQSKLQEVKGENGALEDLELALSFLRAQLKRMDGFVSVQSSASKGTTITIYLPADSKKMRPPTLVEQKQMEYTAIESNNSAAEGALALLICSNLESLSLIDQTVSGMGCVTQVKRLEDVLTLLEAPIDFGGSGFEMPEGEHVSGAKESYELPLVKVEQDGIGAIVLEVEEWEDSVVSLLRHLEERHPHTPKVLVLPQPEAQGIDIGNWVTLPKPLEPSRLRELLEVAFSDGSGSGSGPEVGAK